MVAGMLHTPPLLMACGFTSRRWRSKKNDGSRMISFTLSSSVDGELDLYLQNRIEGCLFTTLHVFFCICFLFSM